ncbi:MAG: glycoside hydrolase family 125 protein [Bacteroidota bacterium]
MTTRRTVLKTSAAAVAGIVVGLSPFNEIFAGEKFASRRPPLKKRKFTSDAVESTIASVQKDIDDPELRWLFGNCFPNTLDTTVETGVRAGKPDTFVITGDIHAMWLRDSTAQVWPYLPLLAEDKKLQRLIAGVIHRQSYCIAIDPYANAFNKGKEGSYWQKDLTAMKPELHERKWEIDSLCYPVRLAYGYWKITGDVSVFDSEWETAMMKVIDTFRDQQRMIDKGKYSFRRNTTTPYDTLPLDGYGNPTRPNGLIHSAFRPSDDACIFPMLIPSNLFAIVTLRHLSELLSNFSSDSERAAECDAIADTIEQTVHASAVMEHGKRGLIYAYEIDGFGNALFMDDANVPSLLSLPYLGICRSDDLLYQRTREFVLSEDNPYFFKGTSAEGIGGPHVGLDMIWPLGIIMRALTSDDDEEIRSCLRMLKTTHAGTGFMHESFHKNDPAHFTRKWFAWANTLFGELVLKVHHERPHLLKGNL